MTMYRFFSAKTPVLPALFMVLIAGCSGKQETSTVDNDAEQLYHESAALLKAYTDSIAKAPDSLTWAAIDERLERQLTRLNFKYPADTDLKFDGGMNDTLFSLTTRYVRTREKRIRNILHPVQPQDSTATPKDSLR